VAERCYSPVAKRLERIAARYQDSLAITFSLSGTLIEQLRKHCPDTIEDFCQLFAHQAIEVLAETYYHSLASINDSNEWLTQIAQHSSLISSLFNKQPTAFRDTELIFNNTTATTIARLGYKAMITEGVPQLLGEKQRLYYPAFAGSLDLPVIFRDFERSDDVAFRFSDYLKNGTPLTAKQFVSTLTTEVPSDGCIMLGLDVETFGEHQALHTGVLDFLEDAISLMIETGWLFHTPSSLANSLNGKPSSQRFDCPNTISWADTERDLSAWNGNPLQQRALGAVWQLRPLVEQVADSTVWDVWRKLTASDHFYYMSTKPGSDGQVHQTFNAYESPYDAFIVFMNVINDFARTLRSRESYFASVS
jgi:alpha-amylase